MLGSRPATWRRRWREAALGLIALTVTLEATSVVAAEPQAGLPGAELALPPNSGRAAILGRGMVRPLARRPGLARRSDGRR